MLTPPDLEQALAAAKSRVVELERERVARGADLAGLEIENARLSAENQALRDRVPGTWIDVVGGLRKRTERAEAEANRMREVLELYRAALGAISEDEGGPLPTPRRGKQEMFEIAYSAMRGVRHAALHSVDEPVTQREM